MPVQITIIGLGLIGSSIGLGIGIRKDEYYRIGHDRSQEAAKKAEKLGAVDKTIFNLHRSVEGADIVILAIPVDEIEETLKQIGPDLKENAVLMDTSFSMVAVSTWVKEYLPSGRHFVTLAPSLNAFHLLENVTDVEAAQTGIFNQSLMVISAPPETNPNALQLAADIASLLGANPMFADPFEFDGLIAASCLLPKLAAAGLIHTVMDQPGWRDGRKLAGKVFIDATVPVSMPDETKAYGYASLLNRANILRLLDTYIEELQGLRQLIEVGDAQGLQNQLGSAMEARKVWLDQRISNNWDTRGFAAAPTSGEILGRMIGIKPKNISAAK